MIVILKKRFIFYFADIYFDDLILANERYLFA